MAEVLERELQALWGDYDAPSLGGIKRRVAFIGPLASCGVTIDDGHVRISPDISDADCTIRSDEQGVLLALVTGQRSLVTTLLQGRATVDGDPTLAIAVSGSMPELGRQIAEKIKTQEQEGGTAWPANP